MTTGKKDCKFCDKEGLLILPLRYAAVVAANPANGGADPLSSVPPLGGQLGAGVTDLALGDQAKYAARLGREGYLYVLVDRQPLSGPRIKSWTGYYITHDAYLYQFPIDSPPQILPEFTCDANSCGINASMVAIPNARQVDKAYFLFTPSPMTEAKLKEYRDKADAYVGEKKMQVLNPKAWVDGNQSQPHTLQADEVGSHVVEWTLYKQGKAALSSPLGLAMETQLFPAISAAYAGTPEGKGRLGSLLDAMKRQKAAAIALFDYIGITQELNDFRNAALEGLERYMMATDEYGANNQQRLQVYEAIKEIEDGMKKGVAQARQAAIDESKPSSDAHFERRRNFANSLRQQGKIAEAELVERDIEESLKARQKNYERYIEEGKARAEADWKNKYEGRLDTNEMNTFYDQLKRHTAKAYAQVEARTQQHLNWFESDRLVNAFDVYEKSATIDLTKKEPIHQGFSFALEAALCTHGIGGCELADNKVEAWLTAPSVQRKNLYMRGAFYNQDELIAAAQKANEEIQSAVGPVEFASEVTAAVMLKATKGLVDSFKKTDSAFDEWARNQDQSYSKRWVKAGASGGKLGIEIQMFHWAAHATRVVFRKGLGGSLDKKLTARMSGLLYARLAHVTEVMTYQDLMLPLSERAKAAAKQRRRERREIAKEMKKASKTATAAGARAAKQVDESLETLIADAQKRAKEKALTLEQYIGKGEKALPTNNYHQTRMGVLLGCIEMIALGEKLTHFEPDAKGFLEVGGSIMAVGSIVLDTFYSSAKSLREIEPYRSNTPIRASADVVRGRFKIGAGALGGLAGLCSVALDYMNFKKESDNVLRGIYASRMATGFFSAGLTMAAAYSYAQPMLKVAAQGYAKHSLRYQALLAASKLAGKLAARVRLLVWAARLNWAGLALTVLEVGYLALRDNDLQNWCEKSVFRKEKKYKNWLGRIVTNETFSGATRELEELEKSAQAVGI